MYAFDEDRNAALRNWAHNDMHAWAAVELLIDHGHWPAMLDKAGLLRKFPKTLGGTKDYFARPMLMDALERLDDPDDTSMYASSSEMRILKIAASLTSGYEVKLSDVLVNLDKSNQRRVVEAVGRAVGLVPMI